MRVRWLAAAALVLATSAAAEGLPPGLGSGEPAEVRQVIDGETLRLAHGAEVRLAAILGPYAAPPRPGQRERPDRGIDDLRAAAHRSLAALIEGQRVTVHVVGPAPDRHGRQVAHLAGRNGEWVQAALVSQGLSRVRTTADSSTGADTLLRLEAAAREARLGLWRHEAFRVRSPGELGRWIETFQIVEGTVIPLTSRPGGRFALEQGTDRLILTVSAAARAELRAAGFNPDAVRGMPVRVRVRGWLRWQSGPVIDVTHAAQIERLDPRQTGN